MEPEKLKLSDICIVTRIKKDVKDYENRFRSLGYDTAILGEQRVDKPTMSGLRFATMHRVKGLEFKAIFIVDSTARTMPYFLATQSEDPILRQKSELQERSLFYAAASRARDHLYITCDGRPGTFIEDVDKYLQQAPTS